MATKKKTKTADPFTDAIRHAVEDVVRRCVQERLRELNATLDDRLSDLNSKVLKSLDAHEKATSLMGQSVIELACKIEVPLINAVIKNCEIHEQRSKAALANLIKAREAIDKSLLDASDA